MRLGGWKGAQALLYASGAHSVGSADQRLTRSWHVKTHERSTAGVAVFAKPLLSMCYISGVECEIRIQCATTILLTHSERGIEAEEHAST